MRAIYLPTLLVGWLLIWESTFEPARLIEHDVPVIFNQTADAAATQLTLDSGLLLFIFFCLALVAPSAGTANVH